MVKQRTARSSKSRTRITVQVYRRSRGQRSARHVQSTTVCASMLPALRRFLKQLVIHDLQARAIRLTGPRRGSSMSTGNAASSHPNGAQQNSDRPDSIRSNQSSSSRGPASPNGKPRE